MSATTKTKAAPALVRPELKPGDFVPTYPGQTAGDRRDELARQLSALTATLYGLGGESFRNWDDDIQDGVLWLVHDLAKQIRDLCEGGA